MSRSLGVAQIFAFNAVSVRVRNPKLLARQILIMLLYKVQAIPKASGRTLLDPARSEHQPLEFVSHRLLDCLGLMSVPARVQSLCWNRARGKGPAMVSLFAWKTGPMFSLKGSRDGGSALFILGLIQCSLITPDSSAPCLILHWIR